MIAVDQTGDKILLGRNVSITLLPSPPLFMIPVLTIGPIPREILFGIGWIHRARRDI